MRKSVPPDPDHRYDDYEPDLADLDPFQADSFNDAKARFLASARDHGHPLPGEWEPDSAYLDEMYFDRFNDKLLRFLIENRARLTPLALGRCPKDGRILAGVYFLPVSFTREFRHLNGSEAWLWQEGMRAHPAEPEGTSTPRATLLDEAVKDRTDQRNELPDEAGMFRAHYPDDDTDWPIVTCPGCRKDWIRPRADELAVLLATRRDRKPVQILFQAAEITL